MICGFTDFLHNSEIMVLRIRIIKKETIIMMNCKKKKMVICIAIRKNYFLFLFLGLTLLIRNSKSNLKDLRWIELDWGGNTAEPIVVSLYFIN